MCGITGHWSFAAEDLDPAIFETFTHSLAHRGPDGFGLEHFANVRLQLGHRRLAIIDLSQQGWQPMSYADGRYWITYNGEVYNYLELRNELITYGHRFVSETDTEVILAAYAQWGSACQLRFNGMWAFAIWNAKDRYLFLSRDRFGVKPLHYSIRNGAFSFASELKAFLALPWVDGSFDTEILSETLTNLNGHESTAHTLLPGVQRLPAGHSMRVDADGRAEISRWWDTLEHIQSPRPEYRQQADEFREIFFDACRLRLRSDVPLATSLSGGLDSSAIAATISELSRSGKVVGAPKDWQRAYTICFKGTPNDEEQYARIISQHTGMATHYEYVDEQAAVQNIEKVIFDIESLFQDPKVGHWMVYRAMRANNTYVSLDGSGADELLGGYQGCVETSLESDVSLARYFELRSILKGFDNSARVDVVTEIRRFLARELRRMHLLEPIRAVRTRLRKISARLRLLSESDQHSMPAANSDTVLRPYSGPSQLYYRNRDPETFGMTPFQALLYSWFHGDMLPTLLRNFDRASMAHGIETRMPFMDWRLVTYGFALPETSKIGGGFTKRVLRTAMQGLLPDSIRLRTNKIGFVSPVHAWGAGLFTAWAREVCSDKTFTESPVWNAGAVRRSIDLAIAQNRGIDAAWPIIQAHVLQNSFKARAAENKSHARTTVNAVI